jgi:hypothetical protein
LANNTTYWISVTTGVKSSGEDSLAAAYGSSTTSQFTTAAIAIVPTVSSQTPAVGATGVAITVQPTVVFSTAMDAATITTSTVQLMQGTTAVPESVSLGGDGVTATITPSSSLANNTTYWISVTTGVKSSGEDSLAAAYGSSTTSQFTTLSVAPTITTISPNSGSVEGGTPVTITGTGFVSGATVTIDGNAPTSVVVVNPTTITAVTPPGTDLNNANDVIVTNPNGQASNTTVTFNFTSSLTVNIVGNGTVTPSISIGSGNVTTNTYNSWTTSVKLTAAAATGYTFTGWSGNLSGTTNPATIVMSNDMTVTATFHMLPLVSTGSATVSANAVTLNGNLTNLEGATGAQVAFEWGLGTDYGSITTIQSVTVTGSFTASITGIAAGTTFHYRALAIGSGTGYGIGYGTDAQFTTPTATANPTGSWNPSWTQRSAVTITGTGTALTNYQISLSVPWKANMEANFGDVRFVASDNATVLNYWMTNEVASTSATFWVEVPTIAASGTTTIYMYYGNPSAVTTSNIHTTFIFGDDFADPTYTADHIDPFIGGASTQGVVIGTDGSPEYEMQGDNTKTDNDNRDEPIAQISNTDGSLMQFPENYIAEDDVESSVPYGNVFFNARYLNVSNKYEQLLDFQYHQVVENKVVNDTWTELASAYIGPTTPATNTWYDFEAEVSAGASDGTVLQTFVNGVQEIPNLTDSSLTYNGLAFLNFSVDEPFQAAFRDVTVRQYAAVVPQVSLGGPGPIITTISPTSGTTVGGTSITITGSNFTGATAVQFGNTNASSFTINSATQITATSPAGTAGIVDVTVITPTGISATSSADQFTYTVPAATISSFTPTSGTVGALVTITGTNFNVVTAVTFGGTSATTYTIISNTSITAVVPGAAATGTISVTTPSGTAISTGTFSIIPTVTGISPIGGATTGGFPVTITGTGFAAVGVTVKIGNNTATNVSVTNSTTITATAPGGTAGLQDVVVTNPDSLAGTLKGSFTYTTVTVVSGGGGGGAISGPSTVAGVTNFPSAVNAQGVLNQSVDAWSNDNNVLVYIPAGATILSSSGASVNQISITQMTTPPTVPAGAGIIGLAYDFEPSGTTFTPAATIRFSYNPASVPSGVSPSSLQIAYYNTSTSSWVTLTTTEVDTTNHFIYAQISHFTSYALTYGNVAVTAAPTTTTATTTTPTTTPTTTTATTTTTTTTTTALTTTPTTTTTVAQLTTTISTAATTPITSSSNTTTTGAKTNSSIPVWIFIIVGVVVILIIIVILMASRRRTS